MNFTLHQLKIFIVVADQQSITKAAAILHMTQPAVSIQIKNLQEQFELPITEVLGRKLYITDFGEELYRMAVKILEDVDAIHYRTQGYSGLLSGKLKFAVVSTGKYVLPYYLKHFIDEHPNIEISMDVTNRTKVLASLERNEVDFALVSIMPENIDVASEILIPNKLFLTAAVGSEIVTKKHYNNTVFEEMPLIYREQGSGTRAMMQAYFQTSKVIPKVKLELTSTEAVKQAVLAGLGCSVLSVLSIKNELLEKEIRIIPVKGFPIQANWMLIWLKKKKFSVVGQTYMEHIRKNKASIKKEYFSWLDKY